MIPLTCARLLFLPGRVNDRLRFGQPIAERRRGRRASEAYFAPGQTFAYIRWRAGDYGTEVWSLWVLRAVSPGAPAARVPGLEPGADILLSAAGEGPVRRALALIDAIEAGDADPAEAPDPYWRVAHNRLAARTPLRVWAPAGSAGPAALEAAP